MSFDYDTLGSLFELSRDAVIGVENDAIVLANPAAQADFSLRIGDPAERYVPAYILSDPSDRFVAALRTGSRPREVSVTRTGGLTLLCFAHEAERDTPPGWTRAMAELGGDLFSARLAADAIIGAADAEGDEKLRAYAQAFYRSYFHMKRLHDHLVLAGAILRDELPFSPRMLSLSELCRAVCDTVEPLVRAGGVHVEFAAEDGAFELMADASLIELMLLNLLSNSLLHSSEGGVVRMALSERGSRYILAVDDDGSGMRPERMASLSGAAGELSDPAAGAGLGLVIVRGVAEKHGGAVILESRQDRGTSLRVSLPKPTARDISGLYQTTQPYRTDGLDLVLTELSGVLDKSIYTQKMFD